MSLRRRPFGMTFLSLYPGGGLEWGWDETGTRQ